MNEKRWSGCYVFQKERWQYIPINLTLKLCILLIQQLKGKSLVYVLVSYCKTFSINTGKFPPCPYTVHYLYKYSFINVLDWIIIFVLHPPLQQYVIE